MEVEFRAQTYFAVLDSHTDRLHPSVLPRVSDLHKVLFILTFPFRPFREDFLPTI